MSKSKEETTSLIGTELKKSITNSQEQRSQKCGHLTVDTISLLQELNQYRALISSNQRHLIDKIVGIKLIQTLSIILANGLLISIQMLQNHMKPIKSIEISKSNQTLTNFGITLILLQLLMILAFSIFVRMDVQDDPLDKQRSPALVNTNLMILLGFGYLMTTLKHNNLSALTYCLLCHAIVLQLYLLIQAFWSQIFTAFKMDFYLLLNEQLIAKACYCVASSIIALAAVIGRVNPTELIKMGLIHVVGYTLNEQIIFTALGAFDTAGGMSIFLFGAYFGLTVNYVLSKYVQPLNRPQRTYNSQVLSLLGTLFLWVFWPSFNLAARATTPYQRTQIYINTLCALGGSTLAALVVTSMHGRGILVQDITHATLAGGVGIAAACGIIYIPAVSIGIGFLVGFVSTHALHYLSRKFQKSLKIYDFHGIHGTFGIPALLGAIASVVLIMVYSAGYDSQIAKQYGSYNLFVSDRNFMSKAGMQLVALVSSVGLAIVFGLGGGYFVGLFYQEQPQNFYDDCTYFDRALFLNNQQREIRYEQPPEIKKVSEVHRSKVEKQPPARTDRREKSKRENKGEIVVEQEMKKETIERGGDRNDYPSRSQKKQTIERADVKESASRPSPMKSSQRKSRREIKNK